MSIILLESICLALGGGMLGWIAAHGLNGLTSPLIQARTGVAIGFFDLVSSEILLIPALIVLAILCGFLPAMSAYRTDVTSSLGD
jgi:putative ABC transport system permease protein